MATIALMGPPGSGKSTMAIKTAVKRPVHVLDIDRKVRSMALLSSLPDVTVWELNEALGESGLRERMRSLMSNDPKAVRAPRGWSLFAEYCDKLENNEAAKAAGTIVLDSTTLLAQHMRAHMSYTLGKTKFNFDAWSAWATMWKELTTIFIDYALSHDKDLIFTFHEVASEVPGDTTTKVVVKQKEDVKQREYLGTMAVKIISAVEGSFARNFGAWFTDVYALSVEVTSDKPKWMCRVLPDGQRDLRCSFPVGEQAEWEPDLRKIRKGV